MEYTLPEFDLNQVRRFIHGHIKLLQENPEDSRSPLF